MDDQITPALSESISASVMFNWLQLIQQTLHDTVEVQTIMFFLYVVSNREPVDLTTVANALGLTKAAGSRNFYRLSSGLRGVDGLDLIRPLIDPNDYRRKLLVLTPKGRELAKNLAGKLVKLNK